MVSGSVMKSAVVIFQDGNAIAFSLLAFACWRQWRTRRTASAAWAAAAFGTLAGAALAGVALAGHRVHGDATLWVVRGLLAVLMFFPYFLYRFAASFQPPTRRTQIVAAVPTGIAIVLGLALQKLPSASGPRPVGVTLFLAAVLVQWTLLFSIVARRLWSAGNGEATVPRRRMRTLAVAGVGLIMAVLAICFTRITGASGLLLAARILASVCAVLFFIALSPPRILLYVARRRDFQATARIMSELVAAQTTAEVSAIVLPVTEIVGGRAAALVSPDGHVIATHGETPSEAECVELAQGRASDGVHVHRFKIGTMLLWASPYAPFFGVDEFSVVQHLGGLADIAHERCLLIEQQRTFIANAAHELRTPLTSILGFALTLGRSGDRMSREEYAECAAALQRQGDRVSTLIDNLLDLAQVDSGRIELTMVPVSLAAAARAALEAARPPDGTRVVIEVEEQIRASADAERLEQILVNLLVNAYGHGVSPIRIDVRTDADEVIVAVRDSGLGVPETLRPHLFDPFRRGPSAPRTGSGLGLSISRRLAEAMGGRMWYEPNEPNGATLNVALRRLADEVPSVETERATA
jgi:signal transduction histidine kinase